MTDEKQVEDLEKRIDELESRMGSKLPSRRDALKLGVGGLAGASLMSGTASAGSAQVGTIGNSNNRVDLFGEDVDISDTLTVGGQTTFNGPVAGVEGIPSGGIIMWSGSIANIPSGFALCDGTNGTPDLTDRFVVGAGGSEYSVGDTGGTDTQSVNVPISDSAEVTFEPNNVTQTGNDNRLSASNFEMLFPVFGSSQVNVIEIRTTKSSSAARTAKVDVNTSGSDSFDNRPSYYALAYIMKV